MRASPSAETHAPAEAREGAPVRPASAVGEPVRRREDRRVLTGGGLYVSDLKPDGFVHLAFVRSPVPCGTLAAVDLEEARAMPGVLAVLTAADLRGDGADGEGLAGTLGVNRVLDGPEGPETPVFADGGVRALGQPVAAVVADSAAAAEDAAEAVMVDVEPAEPVLAPDAAIQAPPLFPELSSNTVGARNWTVGDMEAGFAEAAVSVSVAVRHPRLAPSPLEGRATLADWDAAAGTLTVWTSTQTPHRARSDLARVLGLDPEAVRVVAPEVGGAFGMKASLYPEDVAVALASRRLGRPVRWIAQRGEDLLAASHGRGALSRGRMGFDAQGRIVALSADLVFPLGYWLPYSALIPAWNAARILPGPYRVPAAAVSVRAVVTNTAPVGIYRGAGRPEAAMLLERLIEAGARALAMDPADVRRRNLLVPEELPTERPGGVTLDSGDYPEILRRTLARADYDGLRAEQARRRDAGDWVGIGLSLYVEPCGQGWESARVRLEADGRITVASGSSAQGQGRETAYAEIAARALDLAAEYIDVTEGDTAADPAGIGALASRSTAIGGSAVLEAARALRDKARAAAETAGVPPVAGDGIDWVGLAKAVGPVEAETVYTAPGEAWGYGCCLAVVAVDPDTFVPTVERLVYVDDAGTVVNPMLVDGQIVGGIAQGVGEMLHEAVVYDADGQLLTGSLMDYTLPRASDMPPVETDRMVTPSPVNALGAKGVGEAGTIGAPPAILNAALDALAPQGVETLDPPLTPERVWQAVRAAADGAGATAG